MSNYNVRDPRNIPDISKDQEAFLINAEQANSKFGDGHDYQTCKYILDHVTLSWTCDVQFNANQILIQSLKVQYDLNTVR